MSESRVVKASRNVTIGFISKILIMLFAFISRTIFIRILGVEYNGVNGLYSNILTILSLSELGLGNVLNYTLYSALRQGDTEKVKSLVYFFRKTYYVIAFTICAIGLLLVPFLQYIINSNLPHNDLIVYYILYLIDSVVSYFVVYKTTVIHADQNHYISSICETATIIAKNVTQICCLLIFRNFLVFLIIQVLFTIIKNVILNHVANRKYPYLKTLNDGVSKLNENDRCTIVNNIKSTFLYKVSAVILNNTDNILISIIVGTVYVGFYSNYFLIIHYITTFIGIFINGIIASLGNYNDEKDTDSSYKMFSIISLLFCFIGVVSFCCIVNCIQPFIKIWIGEQNVMPFSWVVVIAINMLLTIVMNPIWMFRETMGLFKQVRFVLVVTAILNIVFSIALGYYYGVPGILAATFIAKLVSQYWYEPKILFKKMDKPVRLFYINQLRQIAAIIFATLTSVIACSFIGTNVLCVVLRAFISGIIAIFSVWIFNMKSEAMKTLFVRYIRPTAAWLRSKI